MPYFFRMPRKNTSMSDSIAFSGCAAGKKGYSKARKAVAIAVAVTSTSTIVNCPSETPCERIEEMILISSRFPQRSRQDRIYEG
jgi:hypothetical protein